MLKKAQRIIADDYVNGYLFQLASPTVAKTGVRGCGRTRRRRRST